MITVIGLDGSPLSRRAAEAVAGATLLVGGRRHLAAVGAAGVGVSVAGSRGGRVGGPTRAPRGTTTIPRVIVLGPLRPALDALAAHDGDAVVLASGDPGFFGIVRALRERGLDCAVLPAISSVALAFARAGLPWDDAVVVSAHGRDLRAAVNVCRAYPKVAVLTGPGQGPAEIGAALAGWPRRLLVAEDLGGPGERLTECTPAAASPARVDRPQPGPIPRGHAPSGTGPGSSPPALPSPVTNRSSTPPAPAQRRRRVRDQTIGAARATPIS